PFHTPFPGMVRKAAVLGYRHMIRNTEIEDALAESIGRQPRFEEFDDQEEYEEAISEYVDRLSETEAYQEWYEDVIEPTLDISRNVGNWYTGSVHLARVSALRHALKNNKQIQGDRMLVASYGSGAQAEIHEEIIADNWEQEIKGLNIESQLEDRYDLSFEEYENIHDRHNHDKDIDIEPFTVPEGEFIFDGWGRMNERKYSYID
ncbi:MAG: hydroxymethylglutaryl-CoA synthase, partial [Halobacteriaceae archaeon]